MPPDQPESLELAPSQATIVKHDQDPVAAAIAGLMQKGKLTETDVTALERLSDLYLKLQANDAEKQFAAAFVALQADMPAIAATKPVPNNDGTIRYKYAPYEEIRKAVDPFLQKHGFTITFSTDFRDGRVIQTCTLQHVAGHKRQNQFAARIGRGPPGSSEAQGDGAASTYAKRFALCDCLGIVIEVDQDARAAGAPVTEEQAIYLLEQVKETKSDERMFIGLAGVSLKPDEPITIDTYRAIPADKYELLATALAKKARIKARG